MSNLAGSDDNYLTDNLSALKCISERLLDIFVLPVRNSPGGYFTGGLVSLAEFGLGQHGKQPVGVSGRGRIAQKAFESCMGEAAELVSLLKRTDGPEEERFCTDYSQNKEDLTWALNGIGVPLSVNLESLGWITAKSLVSNHAIQLPHDLVIRKPANKANEKRKTQSTGMGAGATEKDAILSGLMEVIERDAAMLWWYGGSPGYRIPVDLLYSMGISQLAQSIRSENARKWWILDITTDLEISAAVCISTEVDGTAAVGGFGAGLTMAKAAESAFMEMCQMEFAQEHSIYRSKTKSIGELNETDKIWLNRHINLSIKKFPILHGEILKSEICAAKEFCSMNDVLEKLQSKGFCPYTVDLTRSDINIPVVRTIIPGMQSSKPDWISDRLINTAKNNRIDLTECLNQTSPI